MTVLVPRRRILKPQLSIPRLNFRRLGDPTFNRLGVRGQPWGLGRAAAPAQSYLDKILGIQSGSLITCWPLSESSGTIADNAEGTAGLDGTYSSDVSGWPVATGIGDGNSAPSFDGTNDYVQLPSTAIDAVFDGNDGTLALWMKVSGAGVWTDSTSRYLLNLQDNGNQNHVQLFRSANNDQLRGSLEAGNANETLTWSGISSTDWISLILTWNKTGDAVFLYGNGSQRATTDYTGIWVQDFVDLKTIIGAERSTPITLFSGQIAYLTLWTTVLSEAERTSFETV